MMEHPAGNASPAVITCDGLQALIDLLAGRGYQVVGPVVHDGAIVYDRVARVGDLPSGWTDRQEPGRYALARREDAALFGFAVGPQSWKRFLHPPHETLFSVRRDGQQLTVTTPGDEGPRFAFLGVRACEIRAIAVQDRVFCDGPFADAAYAARRRDAFIVAVNCAEPAGTCFCVSMATGPKAEAGYDLALTELIGDGRHEFLVEAGSTAGAALLAELPQRAATNADSAAAAEIVERAAGRMGRTLETAGLKQLLQSQPNHRRWDEVAERCLSCGNCTMVCPTCFCTTVEDHSDLTGTEATRVRKWDSCFTLDFSYLHGGSVRQTGKSRYRQWMTHKLANWFDQFGTSGCVGCGRCITWCPVGIDITEEAAAIRAHPDKAGGEHHGGS